MEQKSGKKKKRQLPNPLRPTNGNEVLRRELGDQMEGQGREGVTGEDVRGDSAKETAELSSVVALLGVTGHCLVPLTPGQC